MKSNALYCFDDIDLEGRVWNKNLFGFNEDEAFRKFDLVYLPCIPEQITDENKHLASSKCLADYNNKKSLEERLQKSIDYSKKPRLTFVYNSERFQPFKFGEKTIARESKVKSLQYKATKPSWVRFRTGIDMIED